MSNVITLLSDFGNRDSYVAQMKAVLISTAAKRLGVASPLQIVDISHEVSPQDVASGARLLQESAMRFPDGTVHLAVVDPGVGTGRRIVAVQADEHFFVAPDNGLLSLVLNATQYVSAYAVENSDLWAAHVSPTFHGRDIMAPVAAFLASGGKITEVGPQAGELIRLLPTVVSQNAPLSSQKESPRDSPSAQPGLALQVIGIDRFGNILTGADRQMIAPFVRGDQLELRIGQAILKASMVETYGLAELGGLVAVFGSQGLLELAIVNGSAARELRVEVGDDLRIHVE